MLYRPEEVKEIFEETFEDLRQRWNAYTPIEQRLIVRWCRLALPVGVALGSVVYIL